MTYSSIDNKEQKRRTCPPAWRKVAAGVLFAFALGLGFGAVSGVAGRAWPSARSPTRVAGRPWMLRSGFAETRRGDAAGTTLICQTGRGDAAGTTWIFCGRIRPENLVADGRRTVLVACLRTPW